MEQLLVELHRMIEYRAAGMLVGELGDADVEGMEAVLLEPDMELMKTISPKRPALISASTII